ncbi:putative transcriptional regulator [Kibdelosporangium banguiense]|uniref:Transcriptional regulator n=1 Tax=Kibdelosporangium banguiense TaxID=1365924 RepID=A0ABS4U3H8_9PSEU|nr:hypothetical protein [Kibdelosporangium banguiense]MBP2331219.1 putative transcriptional regulator [Kibdelosporangium banguiense]
MEAAIQRGRPVTEGFARFLAQAGSGVSKMMTEWSQSSDSAGQAIDDLGGTVEDLLEFVGRLTSSFADDFGPRFGQVQGILGKTEDAVADLAEGVGPLLSGALGMALDATAALLTPVAALVSGFGDLPAPIQAALLGLVAWRAMQSRIVGEHESLGARLSAPWKRFGDEVRLQTALAASAGEGNINRITASMAALESRVPAIARMGEAYRSASTSVEQYVRAQTAVMTGLGGLDGHMSATSTAVDKAGGAVARLGGAAAGTAAALGSGLKTAVSGVVGVLGGPWGIAVTAGVALLGEWISRSAKAKAEQQDLAAAGASVAKALREQNGVINQSVRTQAAKVASDKGLLEQAEKMKLSTWDVVSALLNQGTAYDDIKKKAQDYAQGLKDLYKNGPAGSISIDQMLAGIETSEKFIAALDAVRGGSDAEAAAIRRVAEATGGASTAMAQAPAAAGPMADAMRKMSEIGASAEEKISALKSALDEMAGKRHTVEDANQAVNDSLRGLGDAFKEASAEAKKHGQQLLTNEGAVNTATKAGSDLKNNVDQIADAYRQQYSAAFEAARAQGKDIPEASAIAAAAASQTRDRFLKVAEQFTKSKEEAQKLADFYDIMPAVQATQITQPGMSNAQIAMNLLREYVVKVPGDKSIIVSSNAAPVIETVRSLGFQVQNLKDGSFKIIADTATAQNQITSFIRDNTGKVITLRTVTTTGVTTSSAGGMKFQASGQIMEYFANGGLRPMSASSGAIVAPYTRTGVVRGIGDNPRFDELFLPLDRFSARSQGLLDEALRRMRPEWFSRQFVPMAAGGIWSGGGWSGGSSYDNSRRTSITVNGYSSRDVVQQIAEQQRREELLWPAN